MGSDCLFVELDVFCFRRLWWECWTPLQSVLVHKFFNLVLVHLNTVWAQPTLICLEGRTLFIFRSKLFIGLSFISGVGWVSTRHMPTCFCICTQNRVTEQHATEHSMDSTLTKEYFTSHSASTGNWENRHNMVLGVEPSGLCCWAIPLSNIPNPRHRILKIRQPLSPNCNSHKLSFLVPQTSSNLKMTHSGSCSQICLQFPCMSTSVAVSRRAAKHLGGSGVREA